MLYSLIDIFFVVFHTSLIIFNLSGWIWKKTRFWNLIVLLLTGSSWLILGLVVGTIGYCPLTEWHFRVLEKSGHYDVPVSYIKYLTDRLTGLSFNSNMIDRITLCVFIAVLVISIFLNARDFLRKRAVNANQEKFLDKN